MRYKNLELNENEIFELYNAINSELKILEDRLINIKLPKEEIDKKTGLLNPEIVLRNQLQESIKTLRKIKDKLERTDMVIKKPTRKYLKEKPGVKVESIIK